MYLQTSKKNCRQASEMKSSGSKCNGYNQKEMHDQVTINELAFVSRNDNEL